MKPTLFLIFVFVALQMLVSPTLSYPSRHIYKRQEVGSCEDPESGCPGGNFTPPPAIVEGPIAEGPIDEGVEPVGADAGTPIAEE
ncbi:hypothetical protein BKA69DRAFT_1104069 [Paraphysoderma sedebokerense]|nr:hypothetical protein BKA69DRAFT_1104069 [Paraphysoderma sedebokerense]